MFLLLAILLLLAGLVAGNLAAPRVPDDRAEAASLLAHVPARSSLPKLPPTPQHLVVTSAAAKVAEAFVA